MPDPVTIGTLVVAALAPYLAKAGEAVAEKAGEAGWEGMKSLTALVRRKFTSDNDGEALTTLGLLEKKPESKGYQTAVAELVDAKAATDAGFADELKRLVEAAGQHQTVGKFVTNVSGNAQVGKVISIDKADTITIN
jgi:hypothetical protein